MDSSPKIDALCSGLVPLEVTEGTIRKAIESAFYRTRHTVNRRNLPYRLSAGKLDDIVRGEVAANAVVLYIKLKGLLSCLVYDDIRVDEWVNQDPGWDVLVFPSIPM